MINWAFIIMIAAVIAVIVEAVKKLPFLSRDWKSDTLRDLTIMLIAFVLSTALTTFIGVSMEVCTSIAQGISYSIIVWCTQKAVGQEVLHKALKSKVEKA